MITCEISKITHFQENDVEDGLSNLDLKVNSVSVTNVKVKMLQKYFMFCTFDVLLLDSILIWLNHVNHVILIINNF